MKRNSILGTIATIMAFATVASAQEWQDFTSADGSFSLRYPAGWEVHEQDSAVIIIGGQAQQIAIIAIPYDPARDARGHALLMMELLSQTNPGLEATNWNVDEDGTAVHVETSFIADGVPQSADVVVIADPDAQTAVWFSHSGPAAVYDREAAIDILTEVMLSAAEGASPAAPEGPAAHAPAAGGNEIVSAFVFTLEFAIGHPLGVEAEQIIGRELTRNWVGDAPPEQLHMYPPLAQQIMSLGQAELAGLQGDLQQAISDWINENDPDDPVVGIVRDRIMVGQQVLADGPPPLTFMAGQSYAEMLAFSGLLQREPQASLDDLPLDAVASVRAELIGAWTGLSAEERDEVLTAPGVWGVLRHTLQLGDGNQSAHARSIIAGLTAGAAAETGAQAGAGGAARWFIMQETLRQARQQTFNTWRWSMGYTRTPIGF